MNKKIFIIAGEPSGDLIAAKLVKALRNTDLGPWIEGVGGANMKALGIESLFPMSDISIMGFAEILPKIIRIIYRLHQTYRYILKFKPDIVITIDSPGFNFRLVKMLRAKLGKSIPIIHYVAPSVWAYKPERVKTVKQLYDHQILILPFEAPYFIKAQVPSTYVGHPIFEDLSHATPKPAKPITLAVMPGSRMGEINRHAPIFAESCRLMHKKHPSLKCIVFTLPHLKESLSKHFPEAYFQIIDSHAEKNKMLPKCTAALVKSGTSSLEVLGHMVPMVVAYKVNFITAWYIKRKLNIKYVSIANIIAGKSIIPELLQEKCTPKLISSNLMPLLSNSLQRKHAMSEYKMVQKALIPDGDTASQKAADLVMGFIR